MKKRLLFVFNPRSGKGQIRNNLVDIIDIFVKHGYECVVHPTQESLDAYQLVRNKGGNYDLVVCSGGDGTLNETVRGLMALTKRPVLGYIPTGTTNDFASSLGIPKAPVEAARAIVEGEEFSCDIGSFNHNSFTYISAFGLFTEVAYETPQQTKNMLGHLAYVLEGAKRLNSVKPYRMRVEHDGIVTEDEYIFGMISNSMSVGGIIKNLGELGVQLDDGMFEVALVKMPVNMSELNKTLADVVKLNVNSQYIKMFRTKDITLKSVCPVPWTLDGEYGGDKKQVRIINHQKAITVMKPADSKRK